MLALCSMLYPTYYAKNYAGIMGAGLFMISKCLKLYYKVPNIMGFTEYLQHQTVFK